MQLLVVLLWFLRKESCRQIDKELLLDSMEGNLWTCSLLELWGLL